MSHDELEKRMLKEINVDNSQGRFEVIVLGILFSQWAMREERAYRIWIDIKKWFRENEFDYFEYFSGEDFAKWRQLREYSTTLGFPDSALWNIKYTLDNLKKVEWDLNKLVITSDWKAICMSQDIRCSVVGFAIVLRCYRVRCCLFIAS